MGFTKKIADQLDPQLTSAKEKGNWGEQVACDHLISLGYAIAERQWRGNGFEIDIVATKGTRAVFVEVKTRKSDAVDPVDAVDFRRRQHMIRAADMYLRRSEVPLDYQFDIISITGQAHDYRLEHVQDAFFPNPRTRK